MVSFYSLVTNLWSLQLQIFSFFFFFSVRSGDKTENLSHSKHVEKIRQSSPQEDKVEDQRKSPEILEKSDYEQEVMESL